MESVKNFDDYFMLKGDCTMLIGFYSLQKCTDLIVILAYGAPADAIYEYLQMSENTCLEPMVGFINAMVMVFGE